MILANVRAEAWKYAALAAAIAVLALAAALGWSLWRAERADSRADVMQARAESAEAYTRDLQSQVETERARVEALADIADRELQEREHAQARADHLAAELASGKRRVRHEIAALHTARLSADSAATRELEAAAQRGAEIVAAAVGVGRACDIRQRALVDAYEAVRKN